MFLQFEALYPQVRVYFRLEGLHVEIFSARDVIPLDPNGDCQVSSLYLIFVFFIQQLKERILTQVHLLILLLKYVFNHFEWSSSDNLRSERPFRHLGTAAKAYLHLLRANVRIIFWNWESFNLLSIWSLGQLEWGWQHWIQTSKRLLNCKYFKHKHFCSKLIASY